MFHDEVLGAAFPEIDITTIHVGYPTVINAVSASIYIEAGLGVVDGISKKEVMVQTQAMIVQQRITPTSDVILNFVKLMEENVQKAQKKKTGKQQQTQLVLSAGGAPALQGQLVSDRIEGGTETMFFLPRATMADHGVVRRLLVRPGIPFGMVALMPPPPMTTAPESPMPPTPMGPWATQGRSS